MKTKIRIRIPVLLAGFLLIFSNSCKKADPPALSILDNDGNVIKSVTIGAQIWMAENLRSTKFANGDLIGTTATVTSDISAESTPAYQWPSEGDESSVSNYGRLYTWFAVTDSRNVCPSGWHIPSNDEFSAMMTFLGGDDIAGGKLKETGTTHWADPNTGSTNETGFTALPGGYRGYTGSYNFRGYTGYWWTSTENDAGNSWYRGLYYNGTSDHNLSNSKKAGFSVRCVKNN